MMPSMRKCKRFYSVIKLFEMKLAIHKDTLIFIFSSIYYFLMVRKRSGNKSSNVTFQMPDERMNERAKKTPNKK